MEVRYPPPKKTGISAIPARYHMGAIPPSAILPRKGIARYGGYLALGREAQTAKQAENSQKDVTKDMTLAASGLLFATF